MRFDKVLLEILDVCHIRIANISLSRGLNKEQNPSNRIRQKDNQNGKKFSKCTARLVASRSYNLNDSLPPIMFRSIFSYNQNGQMGSAPSLKVASMPIKLKRTRRFLR